MDQKEFTNQLKEYKKARSKKIISYIPIVILVLIGIFTILLALSLSTQTESYLVEGTAHQSTVPFIANSGMDFAIESHLFLFSSEAKIWWVADYADEVNSPVTVRFIIWGDKVGEWLNYTTSSHEGSENIDSDYITFRWINEENTKDVDIHASITYKVNLLWVVFLFFIGALLIGISCIYANKIQIRNKSISQ